MVVLKELIFNSCLFGCAGLKTTVFFKVSTLREGVVVMIGLIFNSFYFRQG